MPIFIFGCQNNNYTEKLKAEIEELIGRNDSLEKVVNGVKDKYVFVSLTIRQIPHYENINKINSFYKKEFVFVGYNGTGKITVVIRDSTYFKNGMKVFNGDTLISKNGAFQHKIKLEQDRTSYGGIIKIENDYGKSYEIPFRSSFGVKNTKYNRTSYQNPSCFSIINEKPSTNNYFIIFRKWNNSFLTLKRYLLHIGP